MAPQTTLPPQAMMTPQSPLAPQAAIPPPAEENPWAQVAPLPPTPSMPLPLQEWSVSAPPPSPPAETTGLPFEMISSPPPPPAPKKPFTVRLTPPRAPSPPDLLPPPDQRERGSEEDQGHVPFEDIGVHEGKSRGRLLLVAVSVIAVLCLGAAAVWIFFLRPSEMIPLGPTEPQVSVKGAPRSSGLPPGPAATTSGPIAPASPAATPPSAAPSGQPPIVVSSPAQGTPMPSSPAPVKVATPEATPASRPQAASAGEGQRLLASGRFPEAAQAFLGDWGQSAAGYTVEIEVACQADTVAKGAAAAAGKGEYTILPYDLKGRSCYLVVWGTYPDRISADAALNGLPALFQPPAAQPRVVPRAKIVELSRGKK